MKFVKYFFLISSINATLYSAQQPPTTHFSCRNLVPYGITTTEFSHIDCWSSGKRPLVITTDDYFKGTIWALVDKDKHTFNAVGEVNPVYNPETSSCAPTPINFFKILNSSASSALVGVAAGDVIHLYKIMPTELTPLEQARVACTEAARLVQNTVGALISLARTTTSASAQEREKLRVAAQSTRRPLGRSASAVIGSEEVDIPKWILVPLTTSGIAVPQTIQNIAYNHQGVLVLHAPISEVGESYSHAFYHLSPISLGKFTGTRLLRTFDNVVKKDHFFSVRAFNSLAAQDEYTCIGGSANDGKFTVAVVKEIENPVRVAVIKNDTGIPYTPTLFTGLVGLLYKNNKIMDHSTAMSALKKLSQMQTQVLTANNSYALGYSAIGSKVEQFEYKDSNWHAGAAMLCSQKEVPTALSNNIINVVNDTHNQWHLFPDHFVTQLAEAPTPTHNHDCELPSDLSTVFEEVHSPFMPVVHSAPASLMHHPEDDKEFEEVHLVSHEDTEKELLESVAVHHQDPVALAAYAHDSTEHESALCVEQRQEGNPKLEKAIAIVNAECESNEGSQLPLATLDDLEEKNSVSEVPAKGSHKKKKKK